MSYQNNLTQRDLNNQLLMGLMKQLETAQLTALSKDVRINALQNTAEVLEYVVQFINEAVPEEEQAILFKFFMKLLVNVKKAECEIHFKPAKFTDEIAFLRVLISLGFKQEG
jgi:hypothetical protein